MQFLIAVIFPMTVAFVALILVIFNIAYYLRVEPVDLVTRPSREEIRRQQADLRELGLEPSKGGFFTGVVEGIPVRFRRRLVRRGKIQITRHLWQVPVCTGSLALLSPREGAAPSGDPRFDARFSVEGAPADRAWLTPPVRQALLQLPGARLEAGELSCEQQSFDLYQLQAMLRVARLLREVPADPRERLRSAVRDPVAGVRRRALDAAFEHDRALGYELARWLRRDESATVRALASVLLLDDGLLDAARSDAVSASIRARAARALMEVGTTAQRRAAGRALLAHSERSLQDLGLALLRAAGPDAESDLLELVPGADGERLGQILLVLGEVGTVASVPVLRARQAALSRLQSGLSAAIDHTILSLQQPHLTQRGGLAVAGGPEQQGGLSVARGQGAVSRAREG